MKCLCLGICQLTAIIEILKSNKEFSEKYDEILSFPVYETSDEIMKNVIDNILPNCNLILSQPVSSDYRGELFSTKYLRSKIPPNSIHLIIVNSYFTGYDPIPFQLTDMENNFLDIKGINYMPSCCVTNFINNNFEKAIEDWNNPEYYTKEQLSINYKYSINQLKNREKKVFDNDFDIDIKISDFIEKNYKKIFLFHTYNHPTNVLLIELTKRILNKLNIKNTKVNINNELLNRTSIPPSISVYKKTNMTFKYPDFYINYLPYSVKDAFKQYYDCFNTFDDKHKLKWEATIKYCNLKFTKELKEYI